MRNIPFFMLTKRVLLIIMLISLHTRAMDKPIKMGKQIQRKKQAYCKELITNTATLPHDIKKHIVCFLLNLNTESDDEFIKRVKTTTKQKLPDNYYYKNLKTPRPSKYYLASCSIPTGLCPDNTHVAISIGNHLQIINCKKHSIVHKQNRSLRCGHIALSSDIRTIATIHKERSNLNNSEDVLTIKNILTEKTELLTLPSNFYIAYTNYPELGLAFNEQGTRVIIRGRDKSAQKLSSDNDEPGNKDYYDYLSHHLIIPVTINGPLPYLNKDLFLLLHNIMKGTMPKKSQKKDPATDKQAHVTEFIKNMIVLPLEIKRYILHILPLCGIESQNEFVARVSTTKKMALPAFYYFKNLEIPEPTENNHLRPPIITGSCPDNSHVAVSHGNHLQIIDTKKHSILYTEEPFEPNPALFFRYIALSNDPYTIATIHAETKILRRAKKASFSFTIINVLTLKNMLTQKTESFDLPSTFHISHDKHPTATLAFNQEATYVIVRGIDKTIQKPFSNSDESFQENYDDMLHHLILPVTVNGLCPHLNPYVLFLAEKIMDSAMPKKPKKKHLKLLIPHKIGKKK